MRLSQIKIAGFKSFAGPTVIPVPGDLVGVVGPNGCGKSNVIDAVRWVLGESKASALRGESMQDVIFNGSANRKPIGRASVELIFDNSLGRAAGQWSSYTEISIKRVVQRDGNSTYYINNIHVRRRDIADIFLGTGVGGRGYAIIEQGMISRIIEAKPQELRVFLEEAAGISKYRERRHEAELRLADTRKNMLRAEDIAQELKIQLQHLEAQAKIASQFKETQEKLSITQNLLWLLHKQDAIAQRTRAENEIHQLKLELEAEIAHLCSSKRKFEEVRAQEYTASEKLHQIQGELYAANAAVIRIEQEIQHLCDNSERLSQQILEVEEQLAHIKQQEKIATGNLVDWRKEHERACLAYEVSTKKHIIEHERLPEAEAVFRLRQEEFNVDQRNLLLLEQASHLESSHHTHALKTIQQLESRHDRLMQEKMASPPPDREILIDLEQALEDVVMVLKQKKTVLAHTEDQLSAAIEKEEYAANKVQSLQHALTHAKARFDALQCLQAKLEKNEALNTWLSEHQFDTLPRLWQDIQVEKDWEDALEAVLRERLNSIGFERLEVIQSWENNLPPGKWTLFETTNPPITESAATEHPETPSSKTNWKALREYLTYTHTEIKYVLDEWLYKVFVVESIHQGLLQRTNLNLGEMLVTREGHIFNRHSVTFYTPDSQLHGILTRQQELGRIGAEIDQLNNSLPKQQSILNKTKLGCDELKHTIKLLHQDSKRLQQQHHELQLEKIKRSQLAESVDQRRNQIDNELKEIKQQLVTEISHRQTAEAKLDEYEKQAGELKKQVKQARLSWEAADQLLATQRQQLEVITKKTQEAAFHVKTCQNKINEAEQAIRVIDENTNRLIERQNKLLIDNDSLDEAPLKDQLEAGLSQRKKLEQAVVTTRSDLQNTAHLLRKIENARMVSEQRSHSLQEAINQARLKEQEARFTENRFHEQLSAIKADEEALLPLLGKIKASMLQADINRFNADIAALGAVNLAALEELRASRVRQANLDSQLSDLNEALTVLKNVIQQIDRETQERLLKTFNAVNDNLNEIFPVIFAGGQAKLTLNDGEILDSGVVLTAQPPGKKNSSIHLLSGGEKALAALALVFSLFQLNPAPFCLLDEVDAPLDDSNTERFCELVRKISKQTQFLFISHNKITMEMAQQLVGITMQEQGVSRVVAVDIAEAIKLGNQVNVA